MAAVDPHIKSELDAFVPPRAPPAGWDSIVAAAERSRPRARHRRVFLRAAIAVAVAVGALVLGLAWPFGGGPHGTILERALAAVGDGPVLHVVFRDETGGTLVDLETGQRRPVYSEREIWYDPHRGLRQVLRFGGVLQQDGLIPSRGVDRHSRETFSGFTTGYREALENGTARVVAPDVVDGTPVYWIRFKGEMLYDVGDHMDHEWSHEVAVDRETFRPVFVRETRDGKPAEFTGAAVLEMESLPAGAGDFSSSSKPDLSGVAMMEGNTGELTLAEARRLVDGAVWAGQAVSDIQLGRIWHRVHAVGYDRATGKWEHRWDGAAFFYGHVVDGGPHPDYADYGRPFVSITDSATPEGSIYPGARAYVPPAGSLLLTPGHRGQLERNGVYVTIEASSDELVLAAARALEPVPVG
jgi:hypothetical protein